MGIRVFVRSVACLFAAASSFAACAADGKPRWKYEDDGRDILSRPLEIPTSAIPDLDAFTLEATLRFDAREDFTFFPLFDCTVSETGFGLALTFMNDRGNQVYLMENGQRRFVSYAMATVKPGDVRTFVLTARKGWIVVYCDGAVQRRFRSRITPTPDPVTVGRIVDTHWGLGPSNFMTLVKPMKGVRLLSLKVWGSEREYYAPGENRDAVDGFVCGDGWMVEAPVVPDPTKPTLLYVGDSISDGYTPPIKRLAAGKANLCHWTKCWREPSVVEPRQIAEVVACAKPDVIVFNNGLHSLHMTEDRFPNETVVAAYRRLVSLFRTAAPKSSVLYLNTTPNTAKADADGRIVGFGPKNEAVLRLNRLAARAMAEEKVPVIDAYSLMAARIPEARGDGYHWKPAAYEALAAEVWRRAVQ